VSRRRGVLGVVQICIQLRAIVSRGRDAH